MSLHHAHNNYVKSCTPIDIKYCNPIGADEKVASSSRRPSLCPRKPAREAKLTQLAVKALPCLDQCINFQ